MTRGSKEKGPEEGEMLLIQEDGQNRADSDDGRCDDSDDGKRGRETGLAGVSDMRDAMEGDQPRGDA